MAGRFVHFLIAGAAIVGGMITQGDIDLGMHQDDGEVDRTVDRIVDRETDKIVIRSEDKRVAVNPATKHALAAAVAELVRAEGSLITARLDEDLPAAVIKQAEQRRDLAKEAVERIADDAKAETRDNRELRQNIRDDVRDEIRDAVRS